MSSTDLVPAAPLATGVPSTLQHSGE